MRHCHVLGEFPTSTHALPLPEQYRRHIVVDGESIAVSPSLTEGHASHLIRAQLDILDTAGAEQFTALNEVYISVRAAPTSCHS